MPNVNVGQQVAAQFQAVIGDKPEDNTFKEFSLLSLLEKNGAAPKSGGRSAIGACAAGIAGLWRGRRVWR